MGSPCKTSQKRKNSLTFSGGGYDRHYFIEVRKSMSSKLLQKGKSAIKFGVWSVIIGIVALVIKNFTTSSDSQSLLIFAGIILIMAGIPIAILGFILYRSHNLSKSEYKKRSFLTFIGVVLINAVIFAVFFFTVKDTGGSLMVSVISFIITFVMYLVIFPNADNIWCKFCGEKDYDNEEVSRTLIRRYEKTEKKEYTDGGHKRVEYIPFLIEDWNIGYRHNCCGYEYSVKKTLTINKQTGKETWS